MSADSLSQEEIDALLKGDPVSTTEELSGLSRTEEEALKSFIDVLSNSIAEVISSLTGQDFKSTKPNATETNLTALTEMSPPPALCLKAQYTSGISGMTLFLLPGEVALSVGTVMTGNPEATELGDMEVSALSEVFSQALGMASTKLNAFYTAQIMASTPEGTIISNPETELAQFISDPEQRLIMIQYNFADDGGKEHSVIQIIENPTCGELMGLRNKPAAPQKPAAASPAPSKPAPAPPSGGTPEIQPAQFQSFDGSVSSAAPSNLDLIMDIGLEIRVELGRTKLRIKEVLELGAGSVVELNKLAGEQVDLMVNDKLFAKGEVVVIDENFGVRITDILEIKDRIESLGQGRPK